MPWNPKPTLTDEKDPVRFVLVFSPDDLKRIVWNENHWSTPWRLARMLMHAVSEETVVENRNHNVMLPPGQLGVSMTRMESDFLCDRTTVSNFLEQLKSWGLISYQSNNKGTLTDLKFLAGWVTKDGFVQNGFSPYRLNKNEISTPKGKSNDKHMKTENHDW